MFTALKRFLSKLFPKKLATEVTAQLPTPTPVSEPQESHVPPEVLEQLNKAILQQQEDSRDVVLLTEPAPEALVVTEEPVKVEETKEVVEVKKKKKPSKKKSNLRK